MKKLPMLAVWLMTLSAPGCGNDPMLDGKSVGQWRRALSDPNPKVRSQAARKLGEIGVAAKAAIPDLAAALNDADDQVRFAAINALWTIGPDAAEAFPAVIGALKSDKSVEVRESAVRALADIDANLAVAPTSAALTEDADPRVRLKAAEALSKLGRHAATAIPALISALQDADYDVRTAAVDALAAMGSEAKSAVPALQAIANRNQLADPNAVNAALTAIQGK
jgi:HEAT repeat protein